MSSPIAVETNLAPSHPPLRRHRYLSRPQRADALADRIAMHIESLVPQGRVECLDVGCGDLTLAEAVEERLLRTNWHCIDVQRPPSGASDGLGRFNGRAFPYADDEFDVAVLCDSLRGHPRDQTARILVEAARVARHVLVKDCFREAEQCFTREAFGQLVAEQRLVITAFDFGLGGGDDLSTASVLGGDWRFIAVLLRA